MMSMLLVVLVLVCLELLFLALQRILKQSDQELEEMQRTLSQARLAPGTQSYCRQCRYYGANRYIVCALHPEGWPSTEALRCVDWETAEGARHETR